MHVLLSVFTHCKQRTDNQYLRSQVTEQCQKQSGEKSTWYQIVRINLAISSVEKKILRFHFVRKALIQLQFRKHRHSYHLLSQS